MRHQIAKKVPSICFVYVLTILAGFSVGCVKKQASRSHTKLVNGQVIGTDVAPAAIRISSELPSKNGTVGLHNYAKCTASWVSHNTVMTAAHCITENGLALPKVSIDDGTGKGLETTKVYPNANYDDRSAGYDVALLVFPDNSIDESKAAKMASSTPKVGDTITIIGYGNFNHTQQSGSGKLACCANFT